MKGLLKMLLIVLARHGDIVTSHFIIKCVLKTIIEHEQYIRTQLRGKSSGTLCLVTCRVLNVILHSSTISDHPSV